MFHVPYSGKKTTIPPCTARVTYTPNESRPGPGWSVSNRTREFRTRAIEYFAGGGGHVLSPRFRMRHFRQITCRSPTASFFALEIINSGIDEFLLLNLLLWKFNERGTFLRSLRILYIWSSFRLAKKSFEVIGPSWRQKLGSYREMIWKDSRATKGLRDVWIVYREANSVSARVENFHFRKRRAVTVTDSRLAEKYGARAKFCARFTRPD